MSIPSSLKWLVGRRARLQGLIEARERELARIAKIRDRLPELKLDLAALDRIIRLHEIPIDPSSIPTIQVSKSSSVRVDKWFKHGEFSRALLTTLATCESGSMSTRQLSDALLIQVGLKYPKEQFDTSDELKFYRLVGVRLKHLCNLGRVDRVRSTQEVREKNNEQAWTLSSRLHARHRSICPIDFLAK